MRRLTVSAGDDWDPAYTHDGKQLLWSSNRSGNFEVWRAASDGSGARQLTADGVDAENPTATPDGKWIVYASANPAQNGVWKIRSDGGGAERLAPGPMTRPRALPRRPLDLLRRHRRQPAARHRPRRRRRGLRDRPAAPGLQHLPVRPQPLAAGFVDPGLARQRSDRGDLPDRAGGRARSRHELEPADSRPRNPGRADRIVRHLPRRGAPFRLDPPEPLGAPAHRRRARRHTLIRGRPDP